MSTSRRDRVNGGASQSAPYYTHQDDKFDTIQEDFSRHLHPTFYNKPTPSLQLISQNSQLTAKSQAAVAYAPQAPVDSVAVVPTTWDTVYDPDHPDADWTGLVKKDAILQKKHVNDHVSLRDNIERNEYGLVSSGKTTDYFERKENNRMKENSNKSGVLIGGIDVEDSDRYKTNYKRFECQERTTRDQLTMEKRINPIKRIPDPAQARGRSTRLADYNPASSMNSPSLSARSEMNNTISTSRNDTVKYNPRVSLLSGIADTLILSGSVPVDRIPPPASSIPGISKDKYRSEVYRTIMSDNYKPYPGYTGTKK